jgi:uncharacterized membrane protein YiaA
MLTDQEIDVYAAKLHRQSNIKAALVLTALAAGITLYFIGVFNLMDEINSFVYNYFGVER